MKLMAFLVFFFSWVALGILPVPFNLLIWFMYFCISLAMVDDIVYWERFHK